MSKFKIRPAPIMTKILVAVRDNPGLRPCQLFRLPALEEHRIGHFWLRSVMDRKGLVFDSNQAAWWETYQAWLCDGEQGPNPRRFRRVSIKLTTQGEAWLASRGL